MSVLYLTWAALGEETLFPLIGISASLYFISLKHVPLFFKSTFLSFTCRKGHKLSRFLPSGYIKQNKNLKQMCTKHAI